MVTRFYWLVIWASLIGCSLDTGDKNTCDAPSDCLPGYSCVAGLCLDDPVWGCLEFDAAEETPEVPTSLRIVLLDEATEAPVVGATVRRCLRSDVDCQSPTLEVVSDMEGAVETELVDEYFEIVAAGYRSTIAMGSPSLEVTRAGVDPLDTHFDLFSVDGFSSLAAGTEVKLDGERGDIEVLVRDCGYRSAGGAQVELDVSDPDIESRYMVNDLPSQTAVETDSASGSILFFRVPPGLRSVGALVADSHEPISGSGTPDTVIVRAGWLTHLAAVPKGVEISDATGD